MKVYGTKKLSPIEINNPKEEEEVSQEKSNEDKPKAQESDPVRKLSGKRKSPE